MGLAERLSEWLLRRRERQEERNMRQVTAYFGSLLKKRRADAAGDTLVFKLVKIAPIRRGIVTMRGYAFVGKTLVCEVGEFMAQVAKTKK